MRFKLNENVTRLMSADFENEVQQKNLQSLSELSSIIDWIRYAITQMNLYHVYFGHGTDNLWDEAYQLVFGALDLPLNLPEPESSALFAARVTAKEADVILDWIKKRTLEQKPLPYITQTAWFSKLPFFVDERVLIPRSPFAELIQNRFSPYIAEHQRPSEILDMCTGSGCIAIALALAYPQSKVDAVDIDNEALDVASINIANYHLEERVFPLQSDLYKGLQGQQYDLIIANPPYVDAEDMADLPAEYFHEPQHALASGIDGLELTVKILINTLEHLKDDGWLFVEVGNSQSNFAERFNELTVDWCNLIQGGSGIFAVSKTQLLNQQDILDELK